MTTHITLTPAREQTLDLSPVDATDEELKELCETYEVGEDKDALAIIPARFKPCPESGCLGTGKVRCNGQLHRLKANVVEITMLGIDLDDVADAAAMAAGDSLKAKGLAFYAWETHGHKPDSGKTNCRFLIPFKEPLPLKHPRQWSAMAWPALIQHLGFDRIAKADQACKDAARIYYTPRKPTEAARREAGYVPGEPLDWRKVLGEALEDIPVATDIPPPLPEDQARAVDLEAIKTQLKKIRVGKEPGGLAWMLKRMLSGTAPTDPPSDERRKAGLPSRYVAWRTIMAAIANAAEGWESQAALLEIAREAFIDETASSPDDHTKWTTLEELLATAVKNAPAHKKQKQAEWEARQKANAGILRRSIEARYGGREAEPKPPADETEEAPKDEPEIQADEDWQEGLIFTVTKKGPELKSCPANLEHMLRKSPQWRDVFRFNRVTHQIEAHGGPFASGVIEFTDDLVARTSDWFQRSKDQIMLGDMTVLSRIRSVAMQNAYDPLQDYLLGLVWDRVERAGMLLPKYFRAPTDDDEGRDISELLTLEGRRFLISAVARALQPGCKVDTVLILESEQGQKKTSAFEVLGGEWYTGQHIDLHDKDSWMTIAQSWIVELGELETFRKSEVTAQKAFFSLRVDKFRKAYGYENGRYPRRCVFVGSTNKSDYLKDETGNRRYWPVRVGEILLALLRQDRDQLWAEAVHAFLSGGKSKCNACATDVEDRCAEHRWWFTKEESQRLGLERQADQRMAPDVFADMIVRFVCEKPEDTRPENVTLLDVLEGIGSDINKGQEMRVSTALRRLGFMKAQRRDEKGERRNLWVVPESLRNAPRITVETPKANVFTKKKAKA